jgi:hypothetical protein
MDAREVRVESDAITAREMAALTSQQYDHWLELAGSLQFEVGLPAIDADRQAYKIVTQGSSADAE